MSSSGSDFLDRLLAPPLPRTTGRQFSWNQVDWSQYGAPATGNGGSAGLADYDELAGDGRVKAEDLATRVAAPPPRTAITGTPLAPAGDPSRFALGRLFQPTDFLQAGNASAAGNSAANSTVAQPSVITNGNSGGSPGSNLGAIRNLLAPPPFHPPIPGLENVRPAPAPSPTPFVASPAARSVTNGGANIPNIPGIPGLPPAPLPNALTPGAGANPSAPAFAPTDVPYRLAPDLHTIVFDPNRQAEGVRQASRDGAVDQSQVAALLTRAQANDQAPPGQKKPYGDSLSAPFLYDFQNHDSPAPFSPAAMNHLATAAQNLDPRVQADPLARLATLKYFGEENTAVENKRGLMKYVHDFHDWYARNGLAQYQTQNLGQGTQVPISPPLVPESWTAGNFLQRSLSNLDPILYDTGPANLKVKTAANLAGASTEWGAAQVAKAITTDEGSGRVASLAALQARQELEPFISDRPVRQQVQILANYMRAGTDHFWNLAGQGRQMSPDQVKAWRADPAGFRLPDGQPPAPLKTAPISPSQFEQIEKLDKFIYPDAGEPRSH